jgi:hypothetical protein
MARKITIHLACDRCAIPRQAKPDESLPHLRLELARVGWISSALYDLDFCPLHAAEGQAQIDELTRQDELDQGIALDDWEVGPRF